MSSLRRIPGKKLSVLERSLNFMVIRQRHFLMKSFNESKFRYCPFLWIFYGRGVNNKINHLHKHSLHTVYKDDNSSFEDLLLKGQLVFFLLKKRLWHSCFPVNFAKFLRTSFFKEHLWWQFQSFTLNQRNIPSHPTELSKVKQLC